MRHLASPFMKQQQGFNLLEIMIALLLLALVITVSVETSNSDFAAYTRMKDGAIARWVALNQLSLVQLEKGFPAVGKRDGKVEMGQINWRWQQEIIETPDENLRKVKVTVFPEGREEEIMALEVAYITNPRPRLRRGAGQ